MAAPHQDPPSPVDENADEALCPTEKRLDLVGNNHHLDIDAFSTTHSVIIEILRRHPLCYSLTTTADIPVIYLQQVWFTLRHDVRDNTQMVVGLLDGAAFQLTRDDIQTLLHLPLVTDSGRVEFEGLLSDDRICHDVHGLGYSGELTRISKFHRNNLAPLWYVLFSILHRCLSGKTKGMDRCSGNFLRLFHAVAYNRHIDYAEIIWRELVSNVRAKGTGNERTFIPFMRFLQLAIRAHMSVDPTIRQRSGNRTCPHHKVFHLARRQEIPGVVPMRIPHAILNIANPQAQSVREYRESLGLEVAPLVQQGKAGLARGTQPVRRIGPRTRSGGVWTARATGRDVLRGNVRGIGVGRGSRSPGSSSDVAISSGTARSPLLSPSPSPQRLSSVQEEMEATASKSESKGERSGSGSGDDEEEEEGEESAQESSSEEFDDEIIPKRRSKRKNDRLKVSQPSISRVAISTTPPHELGQSIEKDVVDPATQMHTPPSYSTASQQEVVSFSYGVIAHTQPASHLENVGIETREQPPRLSTSFSARSLGPFAEFSILPRTPLMTSTVGNGTPIVPPPFDGLRGLGGRPAMVNTMPAMSACSASVFATVAASTSTPSGLGVRPTEFVSKEIMDDALMAVRTELRQEFQAEIQELKRLMKGRDKVTDESVPSSISLPPPPPPPPPPPSSISDMSTADLKALLLSRLLEECSAPTEYEADLLSLLRLRSHAQPPSESTVALHATIQAQQETIRMLRERIAYVEETCRSQAQGTKRGHDDQDDSDRHEGEKRQRLDVVDAVSSEVVQLTDHQPEATSTTLVDTQAQDDDDHAELDASIVPEVEITGASADVIQTVEKPDGGDKKVSEDDIEKTDDLPIDLTGG